MTLIFLTVIQYKLYIVDPWSVAEQNYTNDWKINITAYASAYDFYHLLISQVFVAQLFCSALLDQQYIVQRAKVSPAFNKEPESYRESL